MKTFFLLSFVSFSAFAQTYSGSEISINGLRVSARKHWNFARTATPDVHFCKYMGFEGADRSQTKILKVEPQKMVFFTAEFIPQNPDRISTRDEETRMLDFVVCER